MDRSIVKHCKRFIVKSVIFCLFCIFISSFCLLFPSKTVAYAAQNSSYCLIDVKTKRVLKGENITARLPMASTTKAMTALLACESGKLGEIVTIPKAAVGIEGSSIYLKEGEKLTLRDLTYGLMLRSGNDAATAIALYLGGSIEGFANMMNDKAIKLGLKNTHFTNPHGLHNDNHYTSAYDLAVIAAEGLNNKDCREIVGAKSYTAKQGENTRFFQNKNKLLWNYQGATGFKTGYTKKAGRCLISSSLREGLEVVAVVLNIPSMFEKCSELMDFAHNNYQVNNILKCGDIIADIPIKYGEFASVGITSKEDVSIAVSSSETLSYKMVLPDYINKDMEKSSIVGELQVFIDEQLHFSCDLVTIDKVIILEKTNENK